MQGPGPGSPRAAPQATAPPCHLLTTLASAPSCQMEGVRSTLTSSLVRGLLLCLCWPEVRKVLGERMLRPELEGLRRLFPGTLAQLRWPKDPGEGGKAPGLGSGESGQRSLWGNK